ncbi:hypothetical protein NKG05_30585 [Oerskovia sp. M15]
MKASVTRRVVTVASVLGLVMLSGACAQTSPDGQPTDSASPAAYDPSAEGADWKPQGRLLSRRATRTTSRTCRRTCG